MNLLQAIILSIIEGITEFLPVSSTGHMILAGKLIGVTSSEFVSSFEIFIQLGALLAILMLFGKTITHNKQILTKLAAAFIPTAIIGFILYKWIKKYLLTNPWVVVWSLLLGGIALIVLELLLKRKKAQYETIESIPVGNSIAIGLAQSLSVIPGVSRAAATIIGGQLTGLSRRVAVEFSFLLALPTMIAATGYDLVKSNVFSYSSYEFGLMGIGSTISCITAYIVVKLFMKIIHNQHTFLWFGVYRIVIALLYTAIIII